MIWYFLEDYNENGVTYPRSAKEIAMATKISVTETYLTLQALRDAGLIWRVGRRNLYRYGLKEKTMPMLDKLYKRILRNEPIPADLSINIEELEEAAQEARLQLEMRREEREVVFTIIKSLNKIEIIPEEVCIEKLKGIAEAIVNNLHLQNDPTEKFLEYIHSKLKIMKNYIFGVKIKEGN